MAAKTSWTNMKCTGIQKEHGAIQRKAFDGKQEGKSGEAPRKGF